MYRGSYIPGTGPVGTGSGLCSGGLSGGKPHKYSIAIQHSAKSVVRWIILIGWLSPTFESSCAISGR